MAHTILIQTPDGQTKTMPLSGGRLAVGRSSSVELSFPDDAGLSRQHFALEAVGGDWTVQDLGSKNGTFVNGIPLKARLALRPGDRITAGHLTIIYAAEESAPGVVVFEGGEAALPTTSMLVTSLGDANRTIVVEPGGGAKPSAAMQALIHAGQELAERRPLADLFPLILDLAIQAVNAQRGVLLLLDEAGQLTPKAHKGDAFRISTAVRDRVIGEKSSMLVRDAQLDDAFKGRMSIVEQKVHTMMAVPLETKDRIIGLIYVDSPLVLREFTRNDLSLLTVMANVAAIRIEHARLAEVEAAERVMQRDLTQAAEIQGGMLPARAPEIPGVDLAGFNVPCRTVGGDYYDFFPYGGSVGLALGDVSGKGMPASLMMMALHARVHVLAESPGDLGAFMARLNKATCAACPSNRFITFFFSVLDGATGELRFANAGHNPPVIVRAAGDAEMLEGGGPVLGVLSIAPYSEQSASLAPGDLLVLYSDGVTEANNPDFDEFGEERFVRVLTENRARPASQIVEAVTTALKEFTAGAPQTDDITLVVARRT